MKPLKSLSLILLFLVIAPKANAQDMSNLTAILAEGYTIDELHTLTDVITLNNHRSVLEKRGFKYEKNDTEGGSYIYKKNDYVSFHVNYENGKLTSVHFVSSPQQFYNVIAKIKGDSKFIYSSEKASGAGKLTYYKYLGHSISTNNNYYRITMWPKESTTKTSSSSTTTTSVASPVTAPATIEKYYSAKEIADAMNAHMLAANIGPDGKNYKFEVKGSMNLDKRSIRFISKENVLYLQMNIPRNGDCDYGLKEIKAKWTTRASHMSEGYFYLGFDYSYSCNGQNYKDTFIDFTPTSSFTMLGVTGWLHKNTL